MDIMGLEYRAEWIIYDYIISTQGQGWVCSGFVIGSMVVCNSIQYQDLLCERDARAVIYFLSFLLLVCTIYRATMCYLYIGCET